jgi:hypothetical protein
VRILIALCLLTSIAHAGEPKDPKLATVLSTVPTVIGYATAVGVLASDARGGTAQVIFVAGGTLAIAGPSFGNVYAGNMSPAGMSMRGIAMGVAFVGMFVVAAECEDLEPCPGYPVGKAFLGSAAALLVGGTIYDIATAGRDARRYNKNWRLAPTGNGVSVVGTF